MSQSRIEAFEEMVKADPDQEMVWYGLATEYTKLDRWAEAVEALKNVIRCNADYTAAYQMLGSALVQLGDKAAARQVWVDGIATATRTGAWKAAQHMQGLLAEIETEEQSQFCS